MVTSRQLFNELKKFEKPFTTEQLNRLDNKDLCALYKKAQEKLKGLQSHASNKENQAAINTNKHNHAIEKFKNKYLNALDSIMRVRELDC